MEPSCPLGTIRCIPQTKFPQKPYNKSFIDQVCSVKMAGYWPRSFFACLWPSTSSRSINTQKKNLANIQPSWPRTWSITHTSDMAPRLSGQSFFFWWCFLCIHVYFWELRHKRKFKKLQFCSESLVATLEYWRGLLTGERIGRSDQIMQMNDLSRINRRVRIPLVIVTPIQIVLQYVFSRFIVVENEKTVIQMSSRFAFIIRIIYWMSSCFRLLKMRNKITQNNLSSAKMYKAIAHLILVGPGWPRRVYHS